MSSGLARAFALFTGASILGSLTQLAKAKLTAVALGASGVGVLNQLTNVWSLFSVIASMGFYAGMVRHMSERWAVSDEQGFRSHVSSSTAVLLLSSLVATFIGCLFSKNVSHFVFLDAGARADLVCMTLIAVPLFCMSQVYRAMLNAARSVRSLVRARVASDVLSVVLLAILIYPIGLRGAVLSFIGLHLLYMVFSLHYARHTFGSQRFKPKLTDFSWLEVRKNVGYGFNGLLTVTVGIGTSLLVSSRIIGLLGPSENGIYAMGLKVSTLFLGGLSATATGHYFPSLAGARTEEEMYRLIDKTMSLFFYLIPPIVLGLMVAGEVLMRIVSSEDFTPAAGLILLILPGDLFRVVAETLGVPLLVRRKLALQAGMYLMWAACFVALASTLLPMYGIMGVAAAYLVSQALHGTLVFCAIRWTVGYQISRSCNFTVVRGFALALGGATIMWSVSGRPFQLLLSTGLLATWWVLNYRDPYFASLVRQALGKLRR